MKENFPETFKSQLEKNKNVVHRPGSVRIVRNCALGLTTARGRTQARAQFLPIRTSQPVNIIILGYPKDSNAAAHSVDTGIS